MRLRLLLSVLAVAMVLVLAGVYVLARALGACLSSLPPRESCTVTADGVVVLDADQLANAATIAAVGIRRDLPERAVTVALATAFQESKMRNLSGGDRDSVGLFQQRPSQGWGTVEQVGDPRYASGKFYDKLVTVPGWESMRVTDAAQAVQISAFPELYEQWADRAEILARALRGTTGQAVACTLSQDPARQGEAAVRSLLEDVRLDWGAVGTSSGDMDSLTVTLRPQDEESGWRYAHWLVARAREHGVRSVRYAGSEWVVQRATWKPVDASEGASAGGSTVIAEVYS